MSGAWISQIIWRKPEKRQHDVYHAGHGARACEAASPREERCEAGRRAAITVSWSIHGSLMT